MKRIALISTFILGASGCIETSQQDPIEIQTVTTPRVEIPAQAVEPSLKIDDGELEENTDLHIEQYTIPTRSDSIESSSDPDSNIVDLSAVYVEKAQQSSTTPQPRIFDPAYNRVFGCQPVFHDVTYSWTDVNTGDFACVYIPVSLDQTVTTSQPVKIRARMFNASAGSDFQMTVGQDDPANPASFPLALVNPAAGNADENITFLSDDGHYYLFFDALTANNSSINFRLDVIRNFDDQELNETVGTAFNLTVEETVTGNLDSGVDVDIYSYSAVGSQLRLLVDSTNAHTFIFSLNGGASWSSVGSGLWTLNTTPGSNLLFGFINGPLPNTASDYSFTVYDDRNIEISTMVGEVIYSVGMSNGISQYQTIPGYTVSGFAIPGGVENNFVQFFGQLKISTPNGIQPARFRDVKIDWTQASGGIGSVYFEQDLITDENGHFVHSVFLGECRGSFNHIKYVSGLDPNLWFEFDRERYHVTVERQTGGTRQLNTANEYFFNLCEVRENNQSGKMLDRFTYD